jgi:hypothetical protein
MVAKTLKGLAAEMVRDCETLAGKASGLVKKQVTYALVFAKLNGKTVSTGLDHAAGALDGLGDFTEGYVKKATSQARAVMKHGKVNGVVCELIALASVEERDLIEEAWAFVDQVDVRAAVAERIAANAGKKGGRPPKVKQEPAVSVQTVAAAPAPQTDPLLSAETAALAAIAALVEAGAVEALGRIQAALIEAAKAPLKKAA